MRQTLWAAFTGEGIPVINVYDFNRKKLERLLLDRQANGEALSGEHAVRITVEYYNQILDQYGWSRVRA